MNINMIRLDELSEEKVCELIRRDPSLICDRIPYYAEDIVRKIFYPNLQTLLLEKRPDLHTKLLALQERQPEDVGALKRITNNNGIRKAKVVKDTSMYKQSALAKKAQYLLENNIIRVWDDSLLQEAEQLARNIALIDAGK